MPRRRRALSPIISPLTALLGAATVVACASAPNAAPAATPVAEQPASGGQPSPASQAAQPPAAVRRPLAGLAGERLIFLPIQRLRALDSLGAGRGALPARETLARIDSAIGAEVANRGAARGWIFAPEIVRSARRNAVYAADPAALNVGGLYRQRPDDPMPESLAGQLRTLIALTDARYVLLPIELRTENAAAARQARAVVRLALLDARGDRVVWITDVTTPPAAPAAAMALVPTLMADLVAEP